MEALDTRLHAYRPDIADAALEGRVAAERFVASQPFQVVSAAAAIHNAPSSDAMMMTEALYGERLRVFETEANGWAWVQLETDRYVGWTQIAHLAAGWTEPTHVVGAIRTFAFPNPTSNQHRCWRCLSALASASSARRRIIMRATA